MGGDAGGIKGGEGRGGFGDNAQHTMPPMNARMIATAMIKTIRPTPHPQINTAASTLP